jgi:ribosome-binding ATPase YchF (GTP1/OBG family)
MLNSHFNAELKGFYQNLGSATNTLDLTAGVIHSDFEKGFIRAEVMKYEDYTTLGSESAVKDAGKFKVEGKEYVVEDGDIMHFRFNV